MPRAQATQDAFEARRRAARRTALAMGVVALCVYAGFLLSGVLAK